MAEETVDALLITTRFDESGLDQSARQQIAALRAFISQVNKEGRNIDPLTLDVDQFARELQSAGGDTERFFAALPEEAATARAEIERLNAAVAVFDVPEAAIIQTTDPEQIRLQRAHREEQEELARQLARTQSAASQLRNEEDNLAAAMFRQSPAAAAAGAAARVQAEEVLRAQRLALQAQRLASAAIGGGPPPTPPPVGPWNQLARGYEGAAVAARELEIRNRALLQTMLQTGQGAERAASGSQAMARGMAEASRQVAGLPAASALAGRGFNKLENALTGLLLTSTGVPPAIAGISNALIGLGVNSVPVLGVLAAVAVLAAAYQALTRETREAQEATEKFAREQAEIQRQARSNPYAELARSISGVKGETEGLVNAIARLEGAIERVRSARAVILPIFGPNAAVFAKGFAEEAQRQLQNAQAALQAQQLAFVESTRARVEAVLTARLAAEQEAAQAELRIQQAGLQQRDQQLRTAFEREEVTREQFFARRIDLAREGAAAEIALLQQQRAQEIERAVPEGQERAQAARIRSLEAAIRLRQAELGIQLQQIQAEEERGRAAAQLLPIQRQLADLQARREATAAAGIGSVEFDTSQAEAQLDTLDTQIRSLAAFAEQRPDVGFDTSDARAGLEQLRADLARLIQQGAGGRMRLEFDTALATAQLDALEAKARQAFLTARTEAERELALEAVVRIRAERTARFQQEVQRQLSALEFTVDLTADTTGVERALRERLGIPIPVELDTAAAIQEAEALRDEIGRRIAAAGGEAQAAPIDVQAFEQLTTAIQRALNAPFQALLQGANQAREALAAGQAAIEAERALLAGAGDPSASTADMAAALTRIAPLVTAVESRYREVTAQINAGVGSTEEQIALLREQAALAEDLRQIQAQRAAALPAGLVPSFAPLEAATEAFINARRRLEAAQVAGAGDAARQAQQDAETALAQMEAAREQILGIAEGLNLSNDQALALYEALARAFGVLEGMETAGERLANSIGDVLTIADALANSGLVEFTEQEARAIDGMLRLGDAVARFAGGDIVGGIAGAIGALGSLFGGGPSPVSIALAENTRAIRENTIRRTEGFEGLGGAADAAAIISQVLSTSLGQFLAATTQAPGLGRQSREQLVGELEALGLSFEQLQRLADEFGIEILANGNLVGDALEQLATEMLEAAEAAFRFKEGLFADQRTLENLRSRALGIDQDPMEIFRQQLAAAGAVGAGDLFAPLQEALQTEDAGAIRQAILAMLDAWENNLIDIEDLGGLTRDQWEEILNSGLDAADAIDLLGESATEATRAMINVPQGFRAAQIAFEAQDPGAAMRQVSIPLVDATALAGDGAVLPQLLEAFEKGARGVTVTGPIYVDARDKTAEELFNLINEEATRRGASGGITFQTRPN